ncbi:hypothetical protein WMY93_001740 [Mugilogobius chulae]|uniref:B30.2/SPRY domain-containing protein n=1 Tax=Mugilogobius chulae TaxID=88201 RepID=A0AAW0Q2Q3_9GOBI
MRSLGMVQSSQDHSRDPEEAAQTDLQRNHACAQEIREEERRAPEFQPPPYDASLPEPTCREEFIKHWFPLTFDDRTAQKLLWLSEGGSKVARTSEQCVLSDQTRALRPLPRRACWGFRAYWEVDFDGWVVLGVVCESSPRKVQDGPCGLGRMAARGGGLAGSCYQVWHNAESLDVSLPLSGTMGVYVDQPAGLVKFLLVEGPEGGAREVRVISKFKVDSQEKLLPGFWVGTNSWCVLRKKDA